jgi:uncharacterized membrane protein YedE/YeeE
MGAILAALLSGLLFGAGLVVSQMVDPAKVQGFLDFGGIPAGAWDPSLAFVMAGALAITAPGYWLVLRRTAPVAAPKFLVPTRKDIDARLVSGAALFGIGWGLAGYCPGPAVAALAFGRAETAVFVVAMLLGMGLFSLRERIGSGGAARAGHSA